jgi:GT2 family glycosyltransferase
VVIDNGSVDGSAEAAQHLAQQDDRLAPRIMFSMAGENLGFAAANNRAVALCDTEFVALLNPDAFPEPGWLGALLAAARQHPDTAAFGSRQMLAGTPDRLDGVGDVYHISGLSWRAGHGCRMTAADAQDGEIFSACAAAALYRRAAFDEVGGFDEDFFCYFEDVDLGFRLRLAGYGARYVSNAVVSHVGGGSQGGDRNDFAGFHGHRNLVWCFVKNMPPPLLWACLPAHLLQSIVILAVSVTRGEFRGIVKAKWHALIGLPKCWRKRQFVQAKNRVSATAVWRSLDKSLCRRRCLACQTGSHRSRS